MGNTLQTTMMMSNLLKHIRVILLVLLLTPLVAAVVSPAKNPKFYTDMKKVACTATGCKKGTIPSFTCGLCKKPYCKDHLPTDCTKCKGFEGSCSKYLRRRLSSPAPSDRLDREHERAQQH